MAKEYTIMLATWPVDNIFTVVKGNRFTNYNTDVEIV